MFGFSNYRKRLGVYSYKISKNHRNKNTHAMPLHQKNDLKKKGYKGELKIHDLERHSQRPFGKGGRKGIFRFDIQKVPFYNIPDLNGFKVLLFLLN